MRENKWDSTVEYFQRELDIDVATEYEKLKDLSKIPVEKLTDPYYISVHINNASKNALTAFLMYMKAKRRFEMFEIDFLKGMRDLTRIAISRLAIWIETAEIGRKQITQEMIKEEIAAGRDTGETYRLLVEKRQDLISIRDAMQQFSKLWNDRISALQTQASLAKTKREVVLGK